MKTYVILYNASKDILDQYQVIQGDTPMKALKNTFGRRRFTRVYKNDIRYATIILIRGRVEDGTIVYEGEYRQQLCYKEIV